jgi:molybdate transport system ATP-binding protein
MQPVNQIDVTLRHRIGTLSLDVAFRLSAPWTVLFAPSGAGKTTILRLIAGIDRPDFGRIVLRREWPPLPVKDVVPLDTEAGKFLPPHRRAIPLMGQKLALFPHKTVLENVLYGDGGPGHESGDPQAEALREDRLDRLLALCRIGHLRRKMPNQLSGGERQRVALARVLGAGSAPALLLDEPFSGLDAGLRDELIPELQDWLQKQGTLVLHVTHDVGEVFSTKSEVIRLEGGKVAAHGSPDIVLRTERDRLLRQLR